MTKQQEIDAAKCEELQEQGIDMECFECSCNCCIAQQATPRMFDDKDLMLIKEALKEYKCKAHMVMLKTDADTIPLHPKAMIDIDESTKLLDKVNEYLSK